MNEYSLPSLEELIEKVREHISSPGYIYANAPRWLRDDKEEFETALKQICRRTLELRREQRKESDILVTLGRHGRPFGWNVIGTWELVGVAIAFTRQPPKPRGRPKARKEYPVEKWRRMREKGMSIREIAKAEKVPKSTVHRLLSRPEK